SDAEACLEFLEHHDFGFVHQVLTIQGIQKDSLTSHSNQFQTYLPSILYELVQYGPKYLSDDELKHRLCQHLRDYYFYLGEQVYKQRGQEFWNFHRGKLVAVGYPLSPTRLASCAAFYALTLVLNPKRTAGAATRRLRRVFSRSNWLRVLGNAEIL